MPAANASTDKSAYEVGESVRIEIVWDWEDNPPSGTDLWAWAEIGVQGNALDKYPEFPLHETESDDPVKKGWMCFALNKGRSGQFVAHVHVFAYDDNFNPEIGNDTVVFTVTDVS